MIALIAYQFTEFRRGRYWLVPVLGYLVYLAGFYLRIAEPAPGSYGRGALGMCILGFALSWALCASQLSALWHIAVVAAGSRERAEISRVLLSVMLCVPLAALSVVVTAADHLTRADPIPPLVGALLLYVLFAFVGCVLGVTLARKAGLGWLTPVLLVLGLVLLTILIKA